MDFGVFFWPVCTGGDEMADDRRFEKSAVRIASSMDEKHRVDVEQCWSWEDDGLLLTQKCVTRRCFDPHIWHLTS